MERPRKKPERINPPVERTVRSAITENYAEKKWRPEQSVIDIIQNHLDAIQIRNEKRFLHLVGIHEQYNPENERQQKVTFLMERLWLYSGNEEVTQNAYEQLKKVMPNAPPLESLQQELKEIPNRPQVLVKVSDGQHARFVAYEEVKDLDTSEQVVGFRVIDDGAGFDAGFLGPMGATGKKKHSRTRGGIGEGLKVSVDRLTAMKAKVTLKSFTPDDIWQADPFYENGKLAFRVTSHAEPQIQTGSITDIDFTEALSSALNAGHTAQGKLRVMLNALDPRKGEALGKYFWEFSNRTYKPMPPIIDIANVPADQVTKAIEAIDYRVALPLGIEARAYVRGVYITNRDDILLDYDLPKWGFSGADRKGVKTQALHNAARNLVMETTDPQIMDAIIASMTGGRKIELDEFEFLLKNKLVFTERKALWRESVERVFKFELGKTLFARADTKQEHITLAEQNGYTIIHVNLASSNFNLLRDLYPPGSLLAVEQLETKTEEVKPPNQELPIPREASSLLEPIRLALWQRILDDPYFRKYANAHGQSLVEAWTDSATTPLFVDPQPNVYHGKIPIRFSSKGNRLYIRPDAMPTDQLGFSLELATYIAFANVIIGQEGYSHLTQGILTRFLGNGLREANHSLENITLPTTQLDESGMFVVSFKDSIEATYVQHLLEAGKAIKQAQNPYASATEIRAALEKVRALVDSDSLKNKKAKKTEHRYEIYHNDISIIFGEDAKSEKKKDYSGIKQYFDPYYYINGRLYTVTDTLELEPVDADIYDVLSIAPEREIESPDEKFGEFVNIVHALAAEEKAAHILRQQGLIRPNPVETDKGDGAGRLFFQMLHEYDRLTASGSLKPDQRAYLARFDFDNLPLRNIQLETKPMVLESATTIPEMTFFVGSDTPVAYIPLDVVSTGHPILLELTTYGDPRRKIQIQITRQGDQITATRVAPDEPTTIITRGQEASVELANLQFALYGSVLQLRGSHNYEVHIVQGEEITKPEKPETHQGEPVIRAEIELEYRSKVWDSALRNWEDTAANHDDARPGWKPMRTFTVVDMTTGEIIENVSEEELRTEHNASNMKILTATISDFGKGYATEYLVTMGDSSKTESNIGTNGEGLKLIMISATRAGLYAEAGSHDWIASPFIVKDTSVKNYEMGREEEMQILQYNMRWDPTGKYRDGSYTKFSLVSPTELPIRPGQQFLTPDQLSMLRTKFASETGERWDTWAEVIDPRKRDEQGHAGMDRYILQNSEITPATITVLPDRPGQVFEKRVYIPSDKRIQFLLGYNCSETIINTRERNDYNLGKFVNYVEAYFKNLRDISVMKTILSASVSGREFAEADILSMLGEAEVSYETKALWTQAYYEMFGNDAILSLRNLSMHTTNSGIYKAISDYQYRQQYGNPEEYQETYYSTIRNPSFISQTNSVREVEIDNAVDLEEHLTTNNVVKLSPSLTTFFQKMGIVYTSEDVLEELNAADLPTAIETKEFLASVTQRVANTMADTIEFMLQDPQMSAVLTSITPEIALRDKIALAREGIPVENVHVKSTKWPPAGAVSAKSKKLELSINARLLNGSTTVEELEDTIAHELGHLFFGEKDYNFNFQQVLMGIGLGAERMATQQAA